MSIALRLRAVLGEKGLSIKEASEVIGIPYRTLQNYLLDEREPNAKALSALRTHLGVSVDWLLTGEGQMFRGGGPAHISSEPANSPHEEAVMALYRSLSEKDQREIQSAAEEKKRIREIEQRVEELTAALADGKRQA